MDGRSRIVVAAVAGVVLTAIVAVVVAAKSKGSNEAADRAALRGLVERTVPGMCAMQKDLSLRDRAAAANVFWDEVHSGAHVLSAELTARKSTGLEPFVRAMTRVEEDLRTLAPTLAINADAFARQLESAIVIYDASLSKPC